jgi:hypothetical protein
MAATTLLTLGCSRLFDGFEGGFQIHLEQCQILMDLKAQVLAYRRRYGH